MIRIGHILPKNQSREDGFGLFAEREVIKFIDNAPEECHEPIAVQRFVRFRIQLFRNPLVQRNIPFRQLLGIAQGCPPLNPYGSLAHILLSFPVFQAISWFNPIPTKPATMQMKTHQKLQRGQGLFWGL